MLQPSCAWTEWLDVQDGSEWLSASCSLAVHVQCAAHIPLRTHCLQAAEVCYRRAMPQLPAVLRCVVLCCAVQVGLPGRGAAFYHLCPDAALPAACWPWEDAQQQVAQPRRAAAAAGGCEFGRLATTAATARLPLPCLFCAIHVAAAACCYVHQHAALCSVSHAFGCKSFLGRVGCR